MIFDKFLTLSSYICYVGPVLNTGILFLVVTHISKYCTVVTVGGCSVGCDQISIASAIPLVPYRRLQNHQEHARQLVIELGRSPHPPELLRKTRLKANNEFVDQKSKPHMMPSYLRLHRCLSLKIDPVNLLQLTFQKFIWMSGWD
ncbi:uncharacterized protein LOC132037066 [Lycium ferocissimum]|uniref:uncharacterized protein LOC132037066 n=1 Tax=Lycium ferocissimum TaxID=112874 RepID=UPI002815B156|nr:uncharacterized protein LOC132037066 [Lycium ferocissimum]